MGEKEKCFVKREFKLNVIGSLKKFQWFIFWKISSFNAQVLTNLLNLS